MFLIAGSLTTFTSLNTPVPVPSSIYAIYPVIGHPPLFKGSFHWIVIEVLVEVNLYGAAKFVGFIHEKNE